MVYNGIGFLDMGLIVEGCEYESVNGEVFICGRWVSHAK